MKREGGQQSPVDETILSCCALLNMDDTIPLDILFTGGMAFGFVVAASQHFTDTDRDLCCLLTLKNACCMCPNNCRVTNVAMIQIYGRVYVIGTKLLVLNPQK